MGWHTLIREITVKKFKAGDKVRCVRSDHSHGGYARPGDILEVTEVKSWQHNTFIAGEFCGYNDYWELLPSRPDPLEYLKAQLDDTTLDIYSWRFARKMLKECYGLRRKVVVHTTEEVIYEEPN